MADPSAANSRPYGGRPEDAAALAGMLNVIFYVVRTDASGVNCRRNFRTGKACIILCAVDAVGRVALPQCRPGLLGTAVAQTSSQLDGGAMDNQNVKTTVWARDRGFDGLKRIRVLLWCAVGFW